MADPATPEPDTSEPAGEDVAVAPIEPADWVKPVELIELLQRRIANRRRGVQAPTSSPFYDAEFVAKHRNRKRSTSGG